MSGSQIVVLAMLWLVTCWRAPAAVRAPRQRALWTAFAGLTLAVTVGVPAIGGRIDATSGVLNLSVLLKHLVGIVACGAVLSFVVGMARPDLVPRLRRPHLAFGLSVLASLIVLFSLIPQRAEEADFYQAAPGSLAAAGYTLVFTGYLAVSMAVASWLFWTYSGRAGAGWLRTGLRVLGAGTAAGVCYALLRICQILLHLAGRPMFVGRAVLDGVEWTAIALILVGNSIPAVGVAWRGLRDWHTARRIRGLWASLTDAVPEVVLTARLGHGRRVRLHRLVIEIRDAALVLAPHAPEELRERALATAERSGLPAERRAALAEALWLRAAREARLAGRMPAARAGGADLVFEAAPAPASDFADFAAETRRLRRLADAYHSPAADAFATAALDLQDHQ